MSSLSTTNTDEWSRQVQSALDGDEVAWRDIVDRLAPIAWKVLNTYSLNQADREDAFGSTFFGLYEKLGTIREPAALPGWVATVARNEANSIWRKRQRMVPTDELPVREISIDNIHDDLLNDELVGKVMEAFATLPADAQALIRLLTAVPRLSYDEIANTLDMPRGSIGPTAGRHLTKLRRLLYSYTDGDLL